MAPPVVHVPLPCDYRWRRLLWGSDTVPLPDPTDLEPETRQTCRQFINYHLEECRNTLVTDKRYVLAAECGSQGGETTC